MNSKVTVRIDDSAVRRFQEMTSSEPFKLLTERITAELKRAEDTCERTESEAEWRRAQGAVAALRTVLALPSILLAEMRRSNPI